MHRHKSSGNMLLDIFIPIEVPSGSVYRKKRDFIKEFSLVKKSRRHVTFLKDLVVIVKFFFEKNCHSDIDNMQKTLFDALTRSKYIIDDKIVKKVTAEIKENVGIGGVSLRVYQYNTMDVFNDYF